MKAVNVEQTNGTLQPPDGMENCDAVPVTFAHDPDGQLCVVTVWELSEAEAIEVFKSRRVYLRIAGETMPPVALHVDDPFAEVKP